MAQTKKTATKVVTPEERKESVAKVLKTKVVFITDVNNFRKETAVLIDSDLAEKYIKKGWCEKC